MNGMPQRPMVGLQTNPNRNAIAGLMGNQGGFGFARQGGFNSAHGGFGFNGPPTLPPQGPPGGGQLPVPPSLNFTPGVGTSSPAMTNWAPPQYPPPGPPMPSNPALQPSNMQAQPVNPGSQPYLRPMTR